MTFSFCCFDGISMPYWGNEHEICKSNVMWQTVYRWRLVSLCRMFLQMWIYFDRLLSTKWRWRILSVLLRDLQRRNPWSKHTFPVSYLFSCWRIAHYGRWRKFWYVSGDHKSWTSWGLIQKFLKCLFFMLCAYNHRHWRNNQEEKTYMCLCDVWISGLFYSVCLKFRTFSG